MPLPGTTYKKLSVNEWLEIVHLAEEGMPISKIATNFGVHASVIYSGLKKRHVILGGNAKAASEEAAKREMEVLIGRIKDTKDKYFRYNQVVTELLMKRVVAAEKGEKVISLDEVKAYKLALSALKDGVSNAWKVLGLDKENVDVDKELPELPIRELTELEVQVIRDRQQMEDDLDGLDNLPEDLEELEAEAEVVEEDTIF